MNGQMEFLPILQDFAPCWGRCPKRPKEERRKKEKYNVKKKKRVKEEKRHPGKKGRKEKKQPEKEETSKLFCKEECKLKDISD